MRSPLYARGFTLIELMVVVSLAAILLGIGLPSFNKFVAGQRVKTASSDFSNSAVYARSEAIKRNAEVGVVASAGGWKDGWSVKFGATSLSEQQAYEKLTLSSTATEVVFLGSGRLKGAASPALSIQGGSGVQGRCVSFDLSGLPKVKAGACL